jgi:hypothetical protein
MKKWEIQTKMEIGTWENVCTVTGEDGVVKPMQFDSEDEAWTEMYQHLKDLKAAFEAGNIASFDASDYRVEQVLSLPMYEIGHRMKWYDGRAEKKDMMITYRYHNGEVWRYHVGLIICKAGDYIPERYWHCDSRRHLEGYMVVDYSTEDESAVQIQMAVSQ